jgi:hypothetical protein
MSHIPAGTSIQNVIHWTQMVKSGLFEEFDYGWDNQKNYGTSKPPVYDVGKDNADIYVWF